MDNRISPLACLFHQAADAKAANLEISGSDLGTKRISSKQKHDHSLATTNSISQKKHNEKRLQPAQFSSVHFHLIKTGTSPALHAHRSEFGPKRGRGTLGGKQLPFRSKSASTPRGAVGSPPLPSVRPLPHRCRQSYIARGTHRGGAAPEGTTPRCGSGGRGGGWGMGRSAERRGAGLPRASFHSSRHFFWIWIHWRGFQSN